jgi:hypothetical protein
MTKTKLLKITLIIMALTVLASATIPYVFASGGWQIAPNWRIAPSFHVNTVPLPTLPANQGENPAMQPTPTQTLTPTPNTFPSPNPTQQSQHFNYEDIVWVIIAVICVIGVFLYYREE